MVDARLTKISGNGPTVSINITNIQQMQYPLDTQATVISLPEQKAEQNLLIKMSGNEETVTIGWRLGIDETSPFVSGITESPIAAVDVMMAIRNHMQSTSIADRYLLILPAGGSSPSNPVEYVLSGHVDNFTFSISEDAPEVLMCMFKFTVGNTNLNLDDSSPQGDDSG